MFYVLVTLTFHGLGALSVSTYLAGRCSTPDDPTVGLSPFSAGDRAISRSAANQERGTGRTKRISMRTWAARRGEREKKRSCGGGGGRAGEIRTGESRRVSGYDSKLMRMAGSCRGSSVGWACGVKEHSSSSLILTPLSPKRKWK